jgi:hypothetical protein
MIIHPVSASGAEMAITSNLTTIDLGDASSSDGVAAEGEDAQQQKDKKYID